MLRGQRLEPPRSGALCSAPRHRKREFFEIVAFAVGPGDSSDPAGWPTLPSRAPFVRETPPLWGSKIVIVSVPWCLEEPHIDDGIFKTDAAYQET